MHNIRYQESNRPHEGDSMMMKTTLIVAVALTFSVGGDFVMPKSAFAAGGSSMGGGSFSTPAPRKTPQQQAIDSYNRGIAARDKAEQYEQQLADADTEKKRKKLQKKVNQQYKKAAKAYRSAIKKQPRLYQAHGGLGYALKRLGDFDNAMVAYDESLRLRPEYTPAIEYRAEAYLALARYQDVIDAHAHLAYLDRGHKVELEVAIGSWLDTHARDDTNADFHDWASKTLER